MDNDEENIIRQIIVIHDDPDLKKYLLLLTVYPDSTKDTDEPYRDWSIKTGRQNTYDYLKEMIRAEIIDPNLSFVITGKETEYAKNFSMKENFEPMSNPITVFRFMKFMWETHKVLDDGEFCIDDYALDSSNGDQSILEV